MKLPTYISAVFTLASLKCFGTVTIQFDFDALRDASGNVLNTSTAYVLVANTADSATLPSPTDVLGSELQTGETVGTWTIFYAGLTATSPVTNKPSNAIGTAASIDLASIGVVSGDEWAILWFPGISTTGNGVVVSQSQSYGIFQSYALDPVAIGYGADQAMTFPDDGKSVKTIFYDTEFENTSAPTPSQFTANFTTIPEPATVTLSGLALLALLRRRR